MIKFIKYILFVYRNKKIINNIRNDMFAYQRTYKGHLLRIASLLKTDLNISDESTDYQIYSKLRQTNFDESKIELSRYEVSKILEEIGKMIFTLERDNSKTGFKSGEGITIYSELIKYLPNFNK